MRRRFIRRITRMAIQIRNNRFTVPIHVIYRITRFDRGQLYRPFRIPPRRNSEQTKRIVPLESASG